MNARDLFEMIEPALAAVRAKVTPLLTNFSLAPITGLFALDEARERHAKAGPVTRISSGFAAGMLAGKVVSSLGR
jgi:hypothetical protein